VLDLVAVLGREHAVEELRAELVEPVAHVTVGVGLDDQVAPDLDHLHVAAQDGRDVEDVLERAAVVDDRVAPVQRLGHREVEVVDDVRALPPRGVHGRQLGGAQRPQERVAEPARLLEGLQERALRQRRHDAGAGQLAPRPVGPGEEVLAADRQGPVEADALLARGDQELRVDAREAHRAFLARPLRCSRCECSTSGRGSARGSSTAS
jgi:hypothetical protein